jgi:hypothetical protein
MKRGKTGENCNKKLKKIQIFFGIGFFLFFPQIALSSVIDWIIPPWGLNLEELNQAVKIKPLSGQIDEDKVRSEIELQYFPGKSLKVRKGKVMALIHFSDPSTPGRLYGYTFEGKFFGRVIFFKEYPELFPEMAIRNLKEHYPQGKVIRSFNTAQSNPFFEYKSDKLYIFSTDRGVFFYEPTVLQKVVKAELGQIEQEEKRYEQKAREKSDIPR